MRHITEAAREIEVILETDILVVGSGPGGLAAALGAARAGVDTTLVDRFGCFGGNSLDGEAFKYVADVLVEEAGIRPMLHRTFVAPIVEGGTLRGIITESKSGREAILAKRIIDATGDADIAARAGVPHFTTPKEKMMAASVMFSMSGVDKKKFIDAVKADPQTYKDWSGGARKPP